MIRPTRKKIPFYKISAVELLEMKTVLPITFYFSLVLSLVMTLPMAAFQITHVSLYTFDGDSARDLFRISVSGVGDINGDGLADVIIGAENGGGYARVFVSQGGSDILLSNVNRDEVLNLLEIAPFISLLSGDGFRTEADINADRSVTFLDIAPFITILSSQ